MKDKVVTKRIEEKIWLNDKKILHELMEKNAIVIVAIGSFEITGKELLKLWEERSEIHRQK